MIVVEVTDEGQGHVAMIEDDEDHDRGHVTDVDHVAGVGLMIIEEGQNPRVDHAKTAEAVHDPDPVPAGILPGLDHDKKIKKTIILAK